MQHVPANFLLLLLPAQRQQQVGEYTSDEHYLLVIMLGTLCQQTDILMKVRAKPIYFVHKYVTS